VFFGAPTGFAGMLASPQLPAREQVALRMCSSAGEALPGEIAQRFKAHFGCDIIDGIGSTEMLHVFISNRPGDVRYGTTGKPVPGYEVELRGDDGQPVADGEPGDLYIKGPSAALMYWANPRRPPTPSRAAGPRAATNTCARRRGLLHLRRPQRRHAEGQRHLCVALRGRVDLMLHPACWRPPWSARMTRTASPRPRPSWC
jgi:acyl-CoA synthetase (AMP-forming)/AMP-acid ligase II